MELSSREPSGIISELYDVAEHKGSETQVISIRISLEVAALAQAMADFFGVTRQSIFTRIIDANISDMLQCMHPDDQLKVAHDADQKILDQFQEIGVTIRALGKKDGGAWSFWTDIVQGGES